MGITGARKNWPRQVSQNYELGGKSTKVENGKRAAVEQSRPNDPNCRFVLQNCTPGTKKGQIPSEKHLKQDFGRSGCPVKIFRKLFERIEVSFNWSNRV